MLAGCKLEASAWAPQHNACAKSVGHTSDTLRCDAPAGVVSLCPFLILLSFPVRSTDHVDKSSKRLK